MRGIAIIGNKALGIARALAGLGMTPAASRSVKPIPANILAMVPAPTDNDKTLQSNEPDVVSETMPLIMSKVKRTLYQTKKLAAHLKGSSMAETLRNDSGFVLDYIKYKLDDSANEEIRSPRRTIYDATGDCDCMATLLGSLLMNQGIAFKLRIAKYKNGNDWSHIYIVVPKDQSNKKELSDRASYYVLDPVTNKHDYEVPPTDFKDFTMGLKYLDGFGAGNLGCNCDTKATCDTKPLIKKLRHFVSAEQVVADGMVPTACFLRDHKIPYESKVDEANHQGYFVVPSAQGPLRVSTIITPAEAEILKAVCTTRTAPIPLTREEQLLQLHARTAGVKLNDGNTGILPQSANYILTTPLQADKNILVTSAEGTETKQAQIVKETPAAASPTATATATAPAVKEGYNWFGLLASAGIALMTMPSKGGGSVGLSGVPEQKAAIRKKREVVATMRM